VLLELGRGMVLYPGLELLLAPDGAFEKEPGVAVTDLVGLLLGGKVTCEEARKWEEE
jgi:hypothetical protein